MNTIGVTSPTNNEHGRHWLLFPSAMLKSDPVCFASWCVTKWLTWHPIWEAQAYIGCSSTMTAVLWVVRGDWLDGQDLLLDVYRALLQTDTRLCYWPFPGGWFPAADTECRLGCHAWSTRISPDNNGYTDIRDSAFNKGDTTQRETDRRDTHRDILSAANIVTISFAPGSEKPNPSVFPPLTILGPVVSWDECVGELEGDKMLFHN